MKKNTTSAKFICPICDSIRTANRSTEKMYCRHGSVDFLMKRFGVKKAGVSIMVEGGR